MPELVWYRSLYWRIALGFVAMLAVLLAVQGLVFLYLTGRTTEFFPGRTPAEYAQTIAADLAVALADRPDLDLDSYLNERYSSPYRPFVVVTRDNRVVSSQRVAPPPMLARSAFGRLFSFGGAPGGPGMPGGPNGPGEPRIGSRPDGASRGLPPGAPPAGGPATEVRPSPPDRVATAPSGGDGAAARVPESGGRGREPFGRGRGRGGPGPGGQNQYAPVMVDDVAFAMVAVPMQAPPLSAALRDLGPTLAVVGIGLLAAGTTMAALLIFRPSHKRLRALQQTARDLGSGRAGVRASETGGDEVTALARAFNEMAAGLEERTQALVAADDARRQLLADVSHELMTPLAAIRGYSETMTMPGLELDDATRQRYLTIIGDETVRLEHIVGDLLDLARVEGGGGRWKFESVPVNALFERVLNRHEPQLLERSISLDRRIAEDAGSVYGDANRLEQALQNLAANAIRHTPEGGRVTLSADRVNEEILLAVEDSGPGIPPEHLARVFDRFYKADVSRTGTAVPSGSGLGLSIVQAIVERHGGRVAAMNGPRGGARFEVVLPDAPAPAGPAA